MMGVGDIPPVEKELRKNNWIIASDARSAEKRQKKVEDEYAHLDDTGKSYRESTARPDGRGRSEQRVFYVM